MAQSSKPPQTQLKMPSGYLNLRLTSKMTHKYQLFLQITGSAYEVMSFIQYVKGETTIKL